MGGLRQLQVVVPTKKADDVIEVLKSKKGRVKFVHRVSSDDGFTTTLSCYSTVHGMGRLLAALDSIGCGVVYGRIAVMQVELIKPLPKRVDEEAAARRRAEVTDSPGKAGGSGAASAGAAAASSAYEDAATDKPSFCGKWRVEGSKASMAIEEIYTTIQGGCTISFDFLALVAVASLIAGLGLATNNTVMIVASMLLSPLMSPILGFTLGTALRDWNMVRAGVRTELAGLAMTLFIGMVIGVVFAPWAELFKWPTSEMESRGLPQSMLIGVAFAVPSGVGVALSVTGGGSNALVGVAIAASLLPPVVNCGMLLVFAWFGNVLYGEGSYDSSRFLKLSGYSAFLFTINVAVIYVTALAVFRMKDIQPVRRQMTQWQELPTSLTKAERDKVMARVTGADSAQSGDNSDNAVSADRNTYVSRSDQRAARKAAARRQKVLGSLRTHVVKVGASAMEAKAEAEAAADKSTTDTEDSDDEAEEGEVDGEGAGAGASAAVAGGEKSTAASTSTGNAANGGGPVVAAAAVTVAIGPAPGADSGTSSV